MNNPPDIFCDKCGLCCRMIKNVEVLKLLDRGDGVCIYLNGNECSIYDNRPNICNSKYMFVHYFSKHMTVAEFVIKNQNACLEIKKIFNRKEYREPPIADSSNMLERSREDKDALICWSKYFFSFEGFFYGLWDLLCLST